jgi:hypothetical protein
MENNLNPWVDRRLSALDTSPALEFDSAAAMVRLRRRDRQARFQRRLWFTVAAVAACLVAATFAIRQRSHSASPVSAPLLTAGLRESGRSNAPVLCEIYSDYQCGHCSKTFRETLPRMVAAYVQTGKVRLVHRDLPLAGHRYARIAARYANAAARLGRYDLAAAQIFQSQLSWGATGDIDSQLAAVFPPADMAKLRALVKNPDLDMAIDVDIESARAEKITLIPALVCVVKDRRQIWAPVPDYPVLKGYLDDLLSTNCREGGKTLSC